MRFRPIHIGAGLVALGAAWLAPQPSFALNAKPVNMTDLVRQADQIVAGAVTNVTEGVDAHGLPYTQIELSVVESIRGSASGTFTFRQFGFQTPQPAADGRKRLNLVAGMPQYTKNDHVMLFLSRTSSMGMRTTIGLGQGRFALRGGQYENLASNAGLFRNVDFSRFALNERERFLTTTEIGAVQAETFLGLVRRAVSENWWAPAPPRRGGQINPGRRGANKVVQGNDPGVN